MVVFVAVQRVFDDSELVEGLGTGDSAAAEAFVRQFEPRIRRAVREANVPAADVPDLTQDILIEAVRQITAGQFQHRATLLTWLRHLTRGRVADYWRAASRRGLGKHVPVERAALTERSFLTPAAQEARLLAEQALGSMPVRHRIAITAHCRGGVPIDELARLFGLSVQRTRGIVTEAKRLFRSAICGEKTGRV